MAFGEYFNAMSSFPATAKTAAELRDQNYRYAQARAQGRAYRGSVDPKTGKPIGTAYIQQLISEGVDVDPALAQAARMADIYKQGSEAAQSGIGMESTGANPRRTILAAPDEIQAAQTRLDQPGFFGRMFGKAKPAAAQPQAAAPQAEPLRGTTDESGVSTNHDYDFLGAPSAAQAPVAPKPSSSGPSDIDAHAESSSTRGSENTGVATKPAAEEAPIPAVSATPGSDRDLGSLGSTRLTAPEMGRLPEINVESSAASNPPVDDYFSSMLRDVSLQGAQGAGGSSTTAAPDAGLFAWNPQNDGSNAYMQYRDALDSQLKANGFDSPSTYLKSVYDSALQSNMPPRPSPVLRSIAPGEYYKAQAAYESGVQQAQGKAQQAVVEARAKLSDFAKQFGANVVDQRKTELNSSMVLRDPSKRAEAASLITNGKNIDYVKRDLADAGNDIARLQLVAPAVIRTYVTALNPGQQLSEGNLKEAGLMLFPEFGNSEQMMTQLAAGILLSFKGDNSILKSFAARAEQMGGAPLSARLQRMAEHAESLNRQTLASYVTGATQQPVESPAPVAAPNAAALQAVGVDSTRAAAAPVKPKTLQPKPKPARHAGPKVGDIKNLPDGRRLRYVGPQGWELL